MYPFFLKLSRLMAYLGGIMLVGLIFLTVASVTGRALNGGMHSDFMQSTFPAFAGWLLGLGVGPINGDFELIEAGVAFSIFAFIPLCQITSGHASVDIFTRLMSARKNRILRFLTDTVFAMVLVLIAVQLFGGLQTKLRSGQTTFLLEFPIWWAYAISMIGAVIAALVGVFVAVMRFRELVTGTEILPSELSADH